MAALNLMTHEIDDEVFYLFDENGDFVLDDENAENCCCPVECPNGKRIRLHFEIADSYIDWTIGIEFDETKPFTGAPETYIFGGLSNEGHAWVCTINLGEDPTLTTIELVVNVTGGGSAPYGTNPILTYVNGVDFPGYDGTIPWARTIGGVTGPEALEGWDETPSVGEDNEVGFITIEIDCTPA